MENEYDVYIKYPNEKDLLIARDVKEHFLYTFLESINVKLNNEYYMYSIIIEKTKFSEK